jgi:hypothetical protein
MKKLNMVVLDGGTICYCRIHEYCKNNQLVQDGNDFDYILSPKQKYYMEMPKSLVTNAKPKEMPKLVVDVTLGLSQSIYGNFPR